MMSRYRIWIRGGRLRASLARLDRLPIGRQVANVANLPHLRRSDRMKVPLFPMALRFYNTLSQQVEEFTPASDNTVRMYTCGPTVYDFAHIGNFRTFTFVDLLRKCLRANGFQLEPRHEHHGRG